MKYESVLWLGIFIAASILLLSTAATPGTQPAALIGGVLLAFSTLQIARPFTIKNGRLIPLRFIAVILFLTVYYFPLCFVGSLIGGLSWLQSLCVISTLACLFVVLCAVRLSGNISEDERRRGIDV